MRNEHAQKSFGQVAPKAGNSKVNGQMWTEFESKILHLSWSSVSLMMIRSKIKSLSCPQHFLHYKYMAEIFDAQGHATLKRIVRSGMNWNSSKILRLSSLSVSLKKIRSKLKALSCTQCFFRRAMAGNSEVNGRMWPEFELVRDFMVVLVTCKFDDHMIETEGAIVPTAFSPL